MPRRSATAVLTAALLVGLAGCSGSLPGLGGGGAASTPTAPVAAPSPTNDRVAPPGVGTAPLASTEAAIPLSGDPRATVRIDLLGLQRQGRLLVLTATVTPQNTLAERLTLFGMLGEQSFRPQLIDTDNLKLYEVVQAGGELQTPSVGTRVPSGSPLFVHATFAAPPAEVTTVSVQFADQVPAFPKVPIR